MADFTQDQVDAMIAQAVAAAMVPLQSKITELEAAQATDEVQAAVAAATAPLVAEKEGLQTQLDAAIAAKTAAETALTDVRTYLESEATAVAEAAAIEANKTKRVEEAKAAKVLDEKYIDDNADRFAAMTDEDWTSRLDEWKLVAKATVPPKPVVKTAFQASRQTDAGAAGGTSALKLVGSLRRGEIQPEQKGA